VNHALPARHYFGGEEFARERERLFANAWHAIARTDHLETPGSYRALELFGEPIVLVRDQHGALRAFSNVCRHRAFQIVRGEGVAKRLTCPYHRWSYDLGGELRGAPCMDEVPGFARGDYALPELSLVEWQGFVLANLDPKAQWNAGDLEPLDDLLADWNFATLRSLPPLEYDSPWNWKVMVENFMESYHHLGAHAETLQPRNPAQGTHTLDLEGPFSVLENPAAAGADPFWVFQVFPTLLFFQQRGELAVGTWYEMQIDAPDRFRLRIHPLLPAPLAEDEGVVAMTHEVLRAVHAEDIPMCEGIQRGLRAKLWEPGPLALQEQALVRFHRYLHARLGGHEVTS
jgi:phenylpropionate dioxygenase-like ring-hydroxylating dioxygenase large terminal subunit